MQYTYDILPAERLIVLRYTGPVTVPELRRQTETLWADPLYSLSYNVLADLSHASFGGVSIAEARLYGRFVADHPKSTVGHVAAVFSNPLATALALLFQSIVQARTPINVFSSWDGACAYLGVDAKRLRPSKN